MKCPLLHGNIQEETDRETEKICYDYMRFVIPAVQNNSLNDST